MRGYAKRFQRKFGLSAKSEFSTNFQTLSSLCLELLDPFSREELTDDSDRLTFMSSSNSTSVEDSSATVLDLFLSNFRNYKKNTFSESFKIIENFRHFWKTNTFEKESYALHPVHEQFARRLLGVRPMHDQVLSLSRLSPRSRTISGNLK